MNVLSLCLQHCFIFHKFGRWFSLNSFMGLLKHFFQEKILNSLQRMNLLVMTFFLPENRRKGTKVVSSKPKSWKILKPPMKLHLQFHKYVIIFPPTDCKKQRTPYMFIFDICCLSSQFISGDITKTNASACWNCELNQEGVLLKNVFTTDFSEIELFDELAKGMAAIWRRDNLLDIPWFTIDYVPSLSSFNLYQGYH